MATSNYRFLTEASWTRRAWWTSCLGLLMVAAGCGGPDTGGRVGLSGTVNFQGSPLAQGTIEFATADGSPVSGATIAAGKFDVPAVQGLKPGKYLVRISSIQDSGAPAGAPGTEEERPAVRDLIPEEFNLKSTKFIDVTKEGASDLKFDIP